MEILQFYYIDTKYINFLKKFQKYIWDNDEKGRVRPYLGVILEINEMKYFAPLTSPKSSNSHVKDNLMKIRLDYKNQFLGIINLNNIIPVHESLAAIVVFDKLDNKYRQLLEVQRIVIRKKEMRIIKNSNVLYNKVCHHPEDNDYFVKRCYDFKLLESKCSEFLEMTN